MIIKCACAFFIVRVTPTKPQSKTLSLVEVSRKYYRDEVEQSSLHPHEAILNLLHGQDVKVHEILFLKNASVSRGTKSLQRLHYSTILYNSTFKDFF